MGSSGDNDGMEFQNTDEDILNCHSSGINTNPFFVSAWDPVVSLSQHESFGGSSIVSQSGFANSPYTVMLGNQGGISGTSHLAHYPSDSSFVETVQKFPCFGSGGYSGMAGSLGLSQCGQIVNTGCPSNYTSNTEGNDERNMANGAQSQIHQQLSEEAALKALPNGKRRKRGAESTTPLNTDMKTKGEQKDSPGEISDVPNEQDDRRPKNEQNSGVNSKGKQSAKQSKENSHSGDGSKENYIHVRARRGQATNSHSLAERVRREKISERMRLLQELVPGCNKITGKAVMLDEIINYVQSLQQQVEFLSMKLATVNPELNIDIERILSKEILQSRGGNPSSVFGFSPGINSLPYSHGTFQAGIPIIPNTNPQFPPASQAILDSELQNLFRMGFDSNSAMDSLGPTAGRLKPEEL